MATVYILRCADGSYYTGSTTNLARRMAEHEAGLGANHTRKHAPVVLVWHADFDHVDTAFLWERRIHGWSRAKKELLIEGRYGELSGWSVRQRQERSGP
jgi:putative endonuclease